MLRKACGCLMTVLLAVACGMEGEDLQLRQEEISLVGVPENGYPNYQERLMLVAINRARAAPNVEGETKAACSTDYAVRQPLMPNLNGSRCARFHCANCILNDGGLSHNSYCTLRNDIGSTFENGCDGQASCACQPGTEHFSCTTSGGSGTSPFTRCGYFGYSASAEVGAAGYSDGWQAVWGWMSECAGQDGHRRILTGSYSQIGLGFFTASTRCWSKLYFGDLAGGSVSIYTLPAGVHRARGSGSYDFLVNYYDPGGGPREIYLVLDGTCHPMALELGVAENGTYKASLTGISGCHRYWFLAYTSAGLRRTWPEQGAWGVGSCEDYIPDAPAALCEAPPQDGGQDATDGAADAGGDEADTADGGPDGEDYADAADSGADASADAEDSGGDEPTDTNGDAADTADGGQDGGDYSDSGTDSGPDASAEDEDNGGADGSGVSDGADSGEAADASENGTPEDGADQPFVDAGADAATDGGPPSGETEPVLTGGCSCGTGADGISLIPLVPMLRTVFTRQRKRWYPLVCRLSRGRDAARRA